MRRERLWSATFVAILVFIFFNQVLGAGLNTGTSVYLESMGEGAGLAGIGALVYSFGAAVFRISIGPVVDKRGRGIVMMAAAVFFFIGSLGPLFANDGAFFVIWRIVQGFGIAAGATAAFTAAADVVPMSRLGESVAYSATSQAIAMSLGPLFAIVLASSDVPASMYAGMAVCAFLMGVSAFLGRYEKNPTKLPASSSYRLRWERGEVGREEGGAAEPQAAAPQADEDAGPSPDARRLGFAPKRDGEICDEPGLPPDQDEISPAFVGCRIGGVTSEDEPASSPRPDARQSHSLKHLLGNLFELRALPGALPNMLLSPAYAFSLFFAGVFGGALGVGNPGAYYVLSALAMLAVRFLSSRVFDTAPPLRLMAIATSIGLLGFVLVLVSLLVVAPLRDIAFYAAGICYGVCVGIVTPLGLSVAMKQSPQERWGAATALYYFVFDIAIGSVSALYGVIIEGFGYAPVIICTMVFVVLSFVSAAIGFPREEGAAKR